MDKKIFLNSEEIGFINSNGEIYQNKHGMKEKIGRLQSHMPVRVVNSSGKQVAYVDYKQGKYHAYENESTEIIIERCSGNKASLYFSNEIIVEGGSEEEAIGVAILVSRYRTKDVSNTTSTTSSSRTTRSSSSYSRTSYTSSSSTKSESSSSQSSKANTATKSIFSKACIAVIAVAFIIGLLITQITSCTPMGKLSGQYSPTNEFVYEVDADIPISGTIYIELEKDGRYHLYYDILCHNTSSLSHLDLEAHLSLH